MQISGGKGLHAEGTAGTETGQLACGAESRETWVAAVKDAGAEWKGVMVRGCAGLLTEPCLDSE